MLTAPSLCTMCVGCDKNAAAQSRIEVGESATSTRGVARDENLTNNIRSGGVPRSHHRIKKDGLLRASKRDEQYSKIHNYR